jgi:hypothetical protein
MNLFKKPKYCTFWLKRYYTKSGITYIIHTRMESRDNK